LYILILRLRSISSICAHVYCVAPIRYASVSSLFGIIYSLGNSSSSLRLTPIDFQLDLDRANVVAIL
jgi:hypothetical protein